MTRLDKCELLKSKGYTYDPETGKIFGIKGQEIYRKNGDGYIVLSNRDFKGNLAAHHFGWYMTYGNVDFERLDHQNKNRTDNRICNLRILTHQENLFNTDAKGYCWNKKRNKWRAQIMLNRKTIYLGSFNTEEEARNAYLQAKKIYHTI